MHQYASFTGLIRTILIILLIYYGFKILARLFAPQIAAYLNKKMQQRFQGTFNEYTRYQRQQPKQKEGEVTIDEMPRKNEKTSNNTVGEYVEFEEID